MGSFLFSHQAWAFFPRVTLGSPRKEGTGEVAGLGRQRSPPHNRRERRAGVEAALTHRVGGGAGTENRRSPCRHSKPCRPLSSRP